MHGVFAQFLANVMNRIRAFRRVRSRVEQEIHGLDQVLVEILHAVFFTIGLGGKKRIVTAHGERDSGYFRRRNSLPGAPGKKERQAK